MELVIIIGISLICITLLIQIYAAYKMRRDASKRYLFEFIFPPITVYVVFKFVIKVPEYLVIVSLIHLLVSLNMLTHFYMVRDEFDRQNNKKTAVKGRMGIIYALLLQMFGVALYFVYYMYVVKELKSDPLQMPYLASSIYFGICFILFPFSLRKFGIMVYDNKLLRVFIIGPVILLVSFIFAPFIILYGKFRAVESSDRIYEKKNIEEAIIDNKRGFTSTIIAILIGAVYYFFYYILVVEFLKSDILQMPYLISTIYFAVCFFLFPFSERVFSTIVLENKVLSGIMIPLHVITISFVFAPFVLLYRKFM